MQTIKLQDLNGASLLKGTLFKFPSVRSRHTSPVSSAVSRWTFKPLSFAGGQWVIEATRIGGPCMLLSGVYNSYEAASRAIPEIALRLADLERPQEVDERPQAREDAIVKPAVAGSVR